MCCLPAIVLVILCVIPSFVLVARAACSRERLYRHVPPIWVLGSQCLDFLPEWTQMYCKRPGVVFPESRQNANRKCNSLSGRTRLWYVKHGLIVHGFGGEQKKQKIQNTQTFIWRPLRDNHPRDKPGPVPGTNGAKWWFYSETEQILKKRPVCPRNGHRFATGTGPVCLRQGSCLSRTPSGPKCLPWGAQWLQSVILFLGIN